MKKIAILTILGLTSACGATTIEQAPAARQITIVPDSTALLFSPTVNNPLNMMPAAPIATTPGDENFARLLNSVRSQNNVNGVSHDARLDAAAQAHATDMVDNNYFSHTGLDNSTFGQRITAAGYNFTAAGEAITGNRASEQAALDAWVASAPHNAILNGAAFEDFGLGVAGNGSTSRWVLIMAAE